MEASFKRRTTVSVAVLCGVFLLAGLTFYFLGQVLTSKSADVAAARQTIAERTYALENLSSLKAKNAQADLYMQKVSAILPTQDALINFADFLDNLAKVHNGSTNFNFTGPPVAAVGKQAGFAPFDLVVSAQAVSDLEQFVSDLELKASKYLVNLDSVDLTSTGNGYNADIRGKVYFQ